MSHSTRSVQVSGAFLVNTAQRNADIFEIARRLEQVAQDVSDRKLRRVLAHEIDRLLDVVEASDRAVRGVANIPG